MEEQNSVDQRDRFMHISIDDYFSVLKELTINADSYSSLFDHPDFAFMRSMHQKYGAVFSLYVFNRMTGDTFDLSAMTEKFKQEFSKSAHWLKLGYHSDSEETYSDTLPDSVLVANVRAMYSQIERFASRDNIDRIPRFGFFSVNKNGLVALRDQGLVLGALTADDNRVSNCGLTRMELDIIRDSDRYVDREDNLNYFRSERRLDNLDCDEVVELLDLISMGRNNRKNYILFSHAFDYDSLEKAIEWAFEKQIRFDYPSHNIQ